MKRLGYVFHVESYCLYIWRHRHTTIWRVILVLAGNVFVAKGAVKSVMCCLHKVHINIINIIRMLPISQFWLSTLYICTNMMLISLSGSLPCDTCLHLMIRVSHTRVPYIELICILDFLNAYPLVTHHQTELSLVSMRYDLNFSY